MIRKMLLLICLFISACATDWKGAGFENEQQYELAAARNLSPYGAKLFFSYGVKTPKEYDSAVNEMKSSNYPINNNISETLAEFLENKQKGGQEGLTPTEYRSKLIKLKKEAVDLKSAQVNELENKILERKWAENQKQCELGNYTVFSKNLPGISYYVSNKNFINKLDGLNVTHKTTLPEKFEITLINKGIDMIRELSADPDSYASKVSVEITLQENGEIKTTTINRIIDLQDLLKRKTYLDILRSPPIYTVDKKTALKILCN